MTMEKHPDDKKPVVEYTAKITLPNGEVIEKTISTVGDFPSPRDFDLSCTLFLFLHKILAHYQNLLHKKRPASTITAPTGQSIPNFFITHISNTAFLILQRISSYNHFRQIIYFRQKIAFTPLKAYPLGKSVPSQPFCGNKNNHPFSSQIRRTL